LDQRPVVTGMTNLYPVIALLPFAYYLLLAHFIARPVSHGFLFFYTFFVGLAWVLLRFHVAQLPRQSTIAKSLAALVLFVPMLLFALRHF